MENQAVTDRVKELITPLLEEEGVELVELCFRRVGNRMFLRALLDKAGGITLDECAVISGKIGAILNEDDAIATSYVLEVSSPGLDRPLVTNEDFRRLIGKEIELFLKSAFNDKVHYLGTLRTASEDTLSIETESGLIDIPFEAVNKGRLQIGFKRGEGKGGLK